MSDELNQAAQGQPAGEQKFSADYVHELREENKNWRMKYAEATKAMDDLSKRIAEREKGDAERTAEIERMKPIVEKHQQMIQSQANEIIEKLPESVRSIFEKKAPEDIIQEGTEVLKALDAAQATKREPIPGKLTPTVKKMPSEEFNKLPLEERWQRLRPKMKEK